MTRTSGDASSDSLRALFDRAAEIPADARAAWLDVHVPDPARRVALERLLRADAATGYLDTPAGEHAQRLAVDIEETRPDSLLGQTIGAFRLVRLLGQGGMAAVFLGEREGADFAQRCAVKLLRRGLYSELEQRLFQRERRVLAALEHPNIARLVDGGVTDAGIPYLAMEYIDGVPITDYAATHRLDLHARLRLLLTATQAVEAAHRALIVHRDIKPSNLLVTADGTLKLLDFGIAKLLEEDGEDGTRTFGMFTPGYAAPEQRSGGAVTTATDVYALGVLLHELLLGRRPDDDPPRRPSTLAARHGDLPGGVTARQLRGDLDTILLKALAPEPARRYPGAGALAADLERTLQGRPVAAHPPSRAYLLRKFVQRHRLAVLAGGALTLSTLAALGIALWQAHEAREQALIARLEAQRANQVRDFLVEIFEVAGSSRPEADRPTVDDLMQAAIKRVRSQPMPDATRAKLLVAMARNAIAISEDALARQLSDESLAILRRLPAVDPDDMLEAQLVRIDIIRFDHPSEAHAELRPLLPTLRRIDDPVTARGALLAANVMFRNGMNDEAVDMARVGASRAERVFGADSLRAREAALLPGIALASVRRFDEARAALEPAIARWHAAGLPPQKDLVDALEALAKVHGAQGDHRGAETRLHEVLRMVRAINRKPSPREATLWTHIGASQTYQERFDEAAASFDRAFAIDQSMPDMQALHAGGSRSQLAALEIAQRRFDSAEQELRRAIDILEDGGFTRTDQYPRALFRLALVHFERGRLDEAEQANGRSLALRRKLFGDDHNEVASNLTLQAMLLLARQQPAEALRQVDAALAMLARHVRAGDPERLRAREQRARILHALGRDREALAEAETLLAERRRQPHANVALTGALALQADLLVSLERQPQARQMAREALALRVDPVLLAPGVNAQLRRVAAVDAAVR